MKKVAVTGATGHIGANLVRELLDRDYEVVTLVRESTQALDGLDVKQVRGDLLDEESLCTAFRGVDDVYHLAAFVSIGPRQEQKFDEVNIEGTRNVIKACRAEGVSMLVYFSSIHALDQDSQGREVNEQNSLVSETKVEGRDYDYSKAVAEGLVRESTSRTLRTRIIYPTAVIGPNDFKPSLFGLAMLKMVKGRLHALVSGGYDWVDARDVAWGAVESAETVARHHRFILSGHYVSMTELAAVVAGLSGVAAPGFCCPVWLARLAAPLIGLYARLSDQAPLYTPYSLSVISENKVISHSLASEKLGYTPRPFHDSMSDVYRFYVENGFLDRV